MLTRLFLYIKKKGQYAEEMRGLQLEPMKDTQLKKVIDLCLLTGEVLLKSGAETARVEDTMFRIASSFGITKSQCYVTPTAIMFALDRDEPAKLLRIAERSTDLEKVAMVNNISRQISSGELSIDAALKEIKKIAEADLTYPIWIQILFAALTSACFLIMFGGKWNDFTPALLAGGLGYGVFFYIHKIVKLKFFSEFIAAFVIGVTAFLLVHFGFGYQMDKIIIGSVMPLVPGLLITNAVRDLITGHFASCLSKGAEAFLTSSSIGTGIAIVFAFI